MSKPESLMIDDVKYVRFDAVPAPAPSGNRQVVIVDRGWIFAGDREDHPSDPTKFRLVRAVHVRSWTEIGFDGMIATPKSKKVELRSLSMPVEIPKDSEIFAIPVDPTWGL